MVLARGSSTDGLYWFVCVCVYMGLCCVGNYFGAEGMAALAPALRSVPGLTTLDISCELGQLGRGRHLRDRAGDWGWAERPGLGGDEEGR